MDTVNNGHANQLVYITIPFLGRVPKRVSNFRDFVCSLFPKAIFFTFILVLSENDY